MTVSFLWRLPVGLMGRTVWPNDDSLKVSTVIWASLGFIGCFHITWKSCHSCQLQAGSEAVKHVLLIINEHKHNSCFFLFTGGPPVAYVHFSWVFSCTMSSGSAQDVAVEHFLRDIERRSKRLHCAVIGCEEERSRSDMNLLYRKSRLDWRQRDQEGSKKRWVDQLTGALHMWDYSRVQFCGNINLLTSVNEFNFKILIPSRVHEVRGVCLRSHVQICIPVVQSEVNMVDEIT